MIRRKTFAVVIGSLTASAALHSAAGYPVTFEFTGEITRVNDDDDLLGGAVAVGDPFSGSFTFESTSPDSDPAEPRRGLYLDAITAVSGQVAGLPFLGPVGSTNFVEIQATSRLSLYRPRAQVELIGESLDFGLVLIDSDGTVFSDDSLFVSAPDLALFEVRQFIITDTSEVIPLSLVGELTTLIPEPGTLLLLGFGALLVTRQRRARAENINRPTRRSQDAPFV